MRDDFEINIDILNLLFNYIFEIIYFLIGTIYLFNLNSLNNKLNSINFENNPFLLLSYNNSEPMWYFTFMCLLFIVGILLIYRRYKKYVHISNYYIFMFINLLY